MPELWRESWAYHFGEKERLNIFLTNTLEDIDRVPPQLGAQAIFSKEANAAVALKKHRPVLVVLGNPPYANFGRQNRTPFILGLLDDYKRGLKERKLNLDDDFIKFIRWAHWRIERTDSGVVGFITNNVYLDGLTHRRMRESLSETFDEIYVVNLHDSTKKQETAPDGGKDENVFDIMIGVAIVLLVKTPAGAKGAKKTKRGRLFHADLWGTRETKFAWLARMNANHREMQWTKLKPAKPSFLFVPRDSTHDAEYENGWSLTDIFPVSNNGLKTDRDDLFFDFDKRALERKMQTFFDEKCPADFKSKYRVEDSSSYDIESRREHCRYNVKAFRKCHYRPFDVRWLYYDIGMTSRPAEKVMKHMLVGENLALCALRQSRRGEQGAMLVVDGLANKDIISPFDIGTVFPLYLFPNGALPDDTLFLREEPDLRRPNLAQKFIDDLRTRLGLSFVSVGRGDFKKTFGAEDMFHYIYAILYAPGYQVRYAESLRVDFPRVPLTSDAGVFRQLCVRGTKLVDLHLTRTSKREVIAFPEAGNDTVERVSYEPPPWKPKGPQMKGALHRRWLEYRHEGRVWINAKQYFDGVKPEVWTMRIGGYQVCEKWLKDRKGRVLTHDEIEHYQRTVAALVATRRIVVEIDAIIDAHGGWPLR